MACVRFDSAEHELRKQRILSDGQPVRLRVDWLDDLLAVVLEPEAAFVHLVTDWRASVEAFGPYHVSLAQRGVVTEQDVDELRGRWDGQRLDLCIQFVSDHTGYMELGPIDPLLLDPTIQRLHAAGWYRDRELHISG